MTLAKNEKIIKEWKCSATKKDNAPANKTLTITNKRIVFDSKDDTKINREEIFLSSVKGVKVARKYAKTSACIVFFILSAIAMIAPWFIEALPDIAKYCIVGVGAVLLIVGFCVLGALLRKVSFTLQVYHDATQKMGFYGSVSHEVGATKMAELNISRKEINEIVDTIGALILDAQGSTEEKTETEKIGEILQ